MKWKSRSEQRRPKVRPGWSTIKSLWPVAAVIPAGFVEVAGVPGATAVVGAGIGAYLLRTFPQDYAKAYAAQLQVDKQGQPGALYSAREGKLNDELPHYDVLVGDLGDNAAIGVRAELEAVLTKRLTGRMGFPVTVGVLGRFAEAQSGPEAIREQVQEFDDHVQKLYPGRRADGMVIFTGFESILRGRPFNPNDWRKPIGKMTLAGKEGATYRNGVDVTIVTPYDFTRSPKINWFAGLVYRGLLKSFVTATVKYVEDAGQESEHRRRLTNVLSLFDTEGFADRLRADDITFSERNLYLLSQQSQAPIAELVADAIAPKLEASLRERIRLEKPRILPTGLDWSGSWEDAPDWARTLGRLGQLNPADTAAASASPALGTRAPGLANESAHDRAFTRRNTGKPGWRYRC